MNEIEQAFIALRDVYVNYPKKLALLEEKLKDIEKEIQDLLHVQEIAELNASEGFKIYKEMQRARRDRRKIKDELELLEFVRQLQPFGKPPEKILNKAIGEIRGTANRHVNRTYKMRVREDLQGLVTR